MSKHLRVRGLAEMLDASKRTTYRLNSAGTIPAPLKIGGRPRWAVKEIAADSAAGTGGASELQFINHFTTSEHGRQR